jgi:hypothetical protein
MGPEMKAFTSSSVGREIVPAAVFREFPSAVRRSMASTKPLRRPPIAGLAVPGVLAFILFAVLMPLARAVPNGSDDGMPRVFGTAACYQLVQGTGRMIAWVRWEVGASEDSVVAKFEEDTPAWIIDLTNRWIADAYHWEVTDDQVRQWAGELGDGAWPRAEQLTTPQTIAIWLRRIARQCHELRV